MENKRTLTDCRTLCEEKARKVNAYIKSSWKDQPEVKPLSLPDNTDTVELLYSLIEQHYETVRQLILCKALAEEEKKGLQSALDEKEVSLKEIETRLKDITCKGEEAMEIYSVIREMRLSLPFDTWSDRVIDMISELSSTTDENISSSYVYWGLEIYRAFRKISCIVDKSTSAGTDSLSR